jgi:hypothetical protein
MAIPDTIGWMTKNRGAAAQWIRQTTEATMPSQSAFLGSSFRSKPFIVVIHCILYATTLQNYNCYGTIARKTWDLCAKRSE